MFETNLTVAGKVVTEIVRHTFPNGDRKSSFRLMARERRFNKEAQDWVDGDRVFVQVNCWRRLAEGVAASLVKGDNVVVTGRFFIREYSTENGERRSSAEIDAQALGPDLGWCTVVVERPSWSPSALSTGMPAEEVVAAA
ncbi:single-stranded DNA-binding protein [Actinophytocola sp.]|jgi:single-strand DNA-binding protein|uniref:single-stranded DNA-binding protein n=1 Tax=Actinophytocola sp. TaxID=1872138 RepID=UPI002ED79E51